MRIKQIKPEDRKKKSANDPSRMWNPNWANPRTESELEMCLAWDTEEGLSSESSGPSWITDVNKVREKLDPKEARRIGFPTASTKMQNKRSVDSRGEFIQENEEVSYQIKSATSPKTRSKRMDSNIECSIQDSGKALLAQGVKESTVVKDENEVQMMQAAKAKSVEVVPDWMNRNKKAAQELSLDDITDHVGELQVSTPDKDARSNPPEMTPVIRLFLNQGDNQGWKWMKTFEPVEEAAQQKKESILINTESESSSISTQKAHSLKKVSRFQEELESIDWTKLSSTESPQVQRLPNVLYNASNDSNIPSKTMNGVNDEPLIILDDPSLSFGICPTASSSSLSRMEEMLINLDEKPNKLFSVEDIRAVREPRTFTKERKKRQDSHYRNITSLLHIPNYIPIYIQKPLLDLREFDPLFSQ
ncbi:6959_t:CDS:2 [Acaulospora morrowiae]|uniref:6959_t:CDS:1 n=1 Tax=Acaulospora morrowiae TaxID=94023 RepID=A0A9N9CGY9_9GLOM|nr:6959_t:CDS:2 [Acaulospora morrowiae]